MAQRKISAFFMASLYKDFVLRTFLRYDMKRRDSCGGKQKRGAMRKAKVWIGWILILSVCLEAASVTVVAGGEPEKNGAMALRDRVAELLPPRIHKGKVVIREVRGVWLVEVGPLEMSEEERTLLLSRLGQEGFSPILLTDRGKHGSMDTKRDSRLLQWGFLGLLAGSGLWFVVRRFGETSRLSGKQRELEIRQEQLEREMEEGERRHG
jgi:hypothetical protein